MTGPRYVSSAATPEGPGLPPRREVSDRLCGCGCGQYTLIATHTRRVDGVRRGDPLRYVFGHNRSTGGPRRSDRPCDPGTLAACACCGAIMHKASQDQRECADGHTSMTGRHLCRGCYYTAERNGTLPDYPRALRTRDELLEEWEWMRGQGVGFREFAQRVGMTFTAWDRAYWRARAAGDPRAVRGNDTRERCAA